MSQALDSSECIPLLESVLDSLRVPNPVQSPPKPIVDPEHSVPKNVPTHGFHYPWPSSGCSRHPPPNTGLKTGQANPVVQTRYVRAHPSYEASPLPLFHFAQNEGLGRTPKLGCGKCRSTPIPPPGWLHPVQSSVPKPARPDRQVTSAGPLHPATVVETALLIELIHRRHQLITRWRSRLGQHKSIESDIKPHMGSITPPTGRFP